MTGIYFFRPIGYYGADAEWDFDDLEDTCIECGELLEPDDTDRICKACRADDEPQNEDRGIDLLAEDQLSPPIEE